MSFKVRNPKYVYEYKGNYIGGEYRIPKDPIGEWTVQSPANTEDRIATVSYSYEEVNTAVESAKAAAKSWRETKFAERARILKNYAEVLKSKEDQICEVIARETGKPLWESKTEVGAMVGKVGITLNDSMREIESLEIPDIMPGTKGTAKYKPMGVVAVIGPFNFPGHLPNGHIVPALATGNTIVFKPSEKTPLVGQIIADCLVEAGVPKGVFNLVQGEKEVGRRLCVHEDVKAVLFTGSYEVGNRIQQETLTQHWKLLALEMGGKNAAIVWKDADLELTMLEVFVGAFITAGQRCSATSRVLIHRDLFENFVQKFHQRAKACEIGHPYDNPFMGPLIDAGSVDRFQKFQGIASREGCEVIMRGKALELEDPGHYVTPAVCIAQDSTLENSRKSVFHQNELFGPCVTFVPVDDLEEAVAQANVTQYGLVASVFTKSREVYQQCWENLETGLINWNRSTVGASSRLPFGGLKKSGNHWPTALTSTRYCTFPVASLEVSEPQYKEPTYPGIQWNKEN